jgi:hypothetical protein
MGALTSGNPTGLHGLEQEYLYFYFGRNQYKFIFVEFVGHNIKISHLDLA